MARKIIMTVATAALALAAWSGIASAQDRTGRFFDPTREAPPLTVRKNLPFTDSGTNAPVGYEHEYVIDQTTNYLPVYSSFRPDAFGQGVLPGRFGDVGRGAY